MTELLDAAAVRQISAHRSWRAERPTGGSFRAGLGATAVRIEHDLSPAQLSDDRILQGLVPLVEDGLLTGQDEFERAFVAIVESCGASTSTAWRSFYRNSIAELRGGRSSFSPVHRRARSLISGHSVLEVGSCFGFLALQCAQDGHRVTATDLDPGALRLLGAAAADLGLTVATRHGDARALPFASDSADTVTLIHLLEHLDGPDVTSAIAEALRVARRRVVIAVPYEDEPSPHFGHRQKLTEEHMRAWARPWVADHDVTVFADHGGWLVLDHPRHIER